MFNSKKSNLKKSKLLLLMMAVVMCMLVIVSCAQNANKINTSYNDDTAITGFKHFDGYQLEQSTIVSRHDLRSAIKEPGEPYINATNVEFQK